MSARRRATPADLATLPEHLVGELVDGEIVATPRPAARHARALGALHDTLATPFDRGVGGPGGWIILPEPELHLGGDVLVPDLAGWRRAHLPELPDVAAFELAPDWVCEVLSPATERLDRARKLGVYARERIAHAWLVTPAAMTVEVLGLDGATWRLLAVHDGDARVRAEPFAAVELDLAPLWRR